MNKEIGHNGANNRANNESNLCFRCPHCQKLYKTSADVFDATNNVNQAEFDCSSCVKSFILKNSSDSFGLFTTAQVVTKSFSTCPKCSALKPHQSDECSNCGVFATQYIALQKVESPALFELNQQWQKVVANFDQDQYHQDFINKCHLKLALNFAFQRYADLQKSLGFDSLCEKYIKQIELRMEQQFKTKIAIKPDETHSILSRVSFKQYFFMGIGSLGLLLLIYNKLAPTFPNFNGTIMILTIMAFATGLFSSKQTSP